MAGRPTQKGNSHNTMSYGLQKTELIEILSFNAGTKHMKWISRGPHCSNCNQEPPPFL